MCNLKNNDVGKICCSWLRYWQIALHLLAETEHQLSWPVPHLCLWSPFSNCLPLPQSIFLHLYVYFHISSVFSFLLLLLVSCKCFLTILCTCCSHDVLFLPNRTSQPIWPFQASSCTTLSSTRRRSWKTDAIRWVSQCVCAHGHNCERDVFSCVWMRVSVCVCRYC